MARRGKSRRPIARSGNLLRERVINPGRAIMGAVTAGSLAALLLALGIRELRAIPPRVPLIPPPLPPPDKSGPAPQGVAPEPAEGYESRWLSRRDRSMRRCKANADVMTWPQAVTCSLTSAFPEAAPWTDPIAEGGWLADAAALVQDDMTKSVQEMFGIDTEPTGWQALLWLRGTREIRACFPATPDDRAQIAACAAARLYPGVRWPPGEKSDPWKLEFYTALLTMAKGAPLR